MEGYISEVRLFGPTWAPRTWALCHGQLMAISPNTALFSLIGTIYGGDGRTTFALPDLRGRVAVGQGDGPGLSPVSNGWKGGQERVTLNVLEIASHNHSAAATSTIGNQPSPVGNIPAAENVGVADIYSDASPDGTMNPNMIGRTGGNQPHENRQPWLGISYIICLFGIYPSRS